MLEVLIGALISWVASWVFYRRSSEDLRKEAKALREQTRALREQTNRVLEALREHSISGEVGYETNPETGEPEGIAKKRTATDSLGVNDDAQAEPSTEDRDAEQD
jgi:uncharacterized membrane protein YccC